MNNHYTTLRIDNFNMQDTNAEFQKNDGIIIDDTTNYAMTIIKFSIPISRLPYLIWDGNETSPLYDKLYMSYEFNNTVLTSYILKNDFTTILSELKDNAIYTSVGIMHMLNLLIVKLNNLSPFNMEFTIDNDRLYLTTTDIGFNNDTKKLFVSPIIFNAFCSGFEHEFINGMYKINFSKTIANPLSYVPYQNFNCLQNFSMYTRNVVVTSTTLRTESQFVISAGTQERFNIITDYEINNSIENLDHNILYYTTSIYRIISLMNNGSLSNIDLQIYYTFFGKYYKLKIAPYQHAMFHILFTQK